MPKLSDGSVLVTDQRRADIYEQLLISEDKRVIDVKDLMRLDEFGKYVPFSAWKEGDGELAARVAALIYGQQERTT